VVIGDVMLDEYLWGDSNRLSAEAPVPVVEVRHRSQVPGGAANAAANLASLGGVALLGGVIGHDQAGRHLRARLNRPDMDAAGLVIDPARATTSKVRLLAGSQQIARIDDETRRGIDPPVEDQLLRWTLHQLESADGCIVSDYGKGVVTARVAETVIDSALARGLPVVVDPKGTSYSKYRGATLIKPNAAEVGRLFNEELTELGPLQDAGNRLASMMPGTAVLVTCGRGGMLLFREREPVWHVPAAARQVSDVTGAGDTVISTIALALAAGAELECAIELANQAAGLAVSRCGTVAVSLVDLRAAVAGTAPVRPQAVDASAPDDADCKPDGTLRKGDHAEVPAQAIT
jgi:D-beta-D-heptose 7-phosphate kinase/D-beta-D-heptose 1-phosphate adenosyltransferase